MNKGPIRLGLIGAGRIGHLHAENIARRMTDAELVVISDVRETAARECARELDVPEVVADYRRILERDDIHAVVICSSTDTHTRIIEDAAAARKHVFCEKPVDTDLAKIDRAIDAVRGAGVIFQVAFNRRFDPDYQRVRKAIVDGEIGEPHQIHIISRDPAPPPVEYVRHSGGLFMDMMIHDLDMISFLHDAPVADVYAVGSVRIDPAIGDAGDIDTAVVLVTFENGVTAVIENSRKAVYGYDQRAEVFGSEGSIRIENRHPNTAVISRADCIRRDLPLHFFLERYGESYVAEMRAFLDAVRGGGPSPVPIEAGRMPVVLAMAAARSMKERRPVRIGEITGQPTTS